MIRYFFSFLAATISHLMTFLMVLVVVGLTTNNQEKSSIFLESLIRNAAPLLIAADISGEDLNVVWDRRQHTIQLRLDQATVIGHDVPVYATTRRLLINISYGPAYPHWLMVDRLWLDHPEIHITMSENRGQTKEKKPSGPIKLGALPLRHVTIQNGLVVLQQGAQETRLQSVDALYAVVDQTHSQLTASGTLLYGPSIIPLTLQGSGVLENQALRTLTLELTSNNASVVAPSAANTEQLQLNAKGTIVLDLHQKTAVLSQPLILNLGDSTLTVEGKGGKNEGIMNGTLRATLQNLPLNQLSALWPDTLAAGAKAWVIQHITQGVVPMASLNLTLNGDEERGVNIAKLTAKVNLNNATIAYLPQMTPITETMATLNFDLQGIQGTIERAMMGKTPINQGKITITGFDKDLQNLKIEANLTGPLPEQIAEIMRAIPDDFAKAGLSRDTFGGQATTSIMVAFPLLDDLFFSDVTLSATSKIQKFTMQHVDLPYPVQDGTLNVTFKRNLLDVVGQVKANDIPADITWNGNFQGNTPKTSLSLQAKVPAYVFTPHLPSTASMTGFAKITAKQAAGSDDLTLGIQADTLGISLTAPTWVKEKGTPLDITLRGDKMNRTFVAQSGNQGASGTIRQEANGKTTLQIGNFTLGKNDFRAIISLENGHTHIQATGKKIDLANLITGHADGFERPAEPVDLSILPELSIQANADVLSLDQHDFTTFNVDLDMRNNTLNRFLASGQAKANKPFRFTLNPERTQLLVEAGDSVLLTSMLGLKSRLEGGTMRATISPLAQGRLMPTTKLRLEIRDSVLKRAPVLGRILSLASLSGPLELLTGSGMLMNQINMDARAGKDTLIIDNLEMKNTSIGVFFTGKVGLSDNSITGNGAVIPAYGISRVVSSIPLIGQLLTSRDNGILSIPFSLEGKQDDPSISVNPLTALTPGVLQDLFGVGQRR